MSYSGIWVTLTTPIDVLVGLELVLLSCFHDSLSNKCSFAIIVDVCKLFEVLRTTGSVFTY